jgi:hypothetical protein
MHVSRARKSVSPVLSPSSVRETIARNPAARRAFERVVESHARRVTNEAALIRLQGSHKKHITPADLRRAKLEIGREIAKLKL